MTAHTPGPWKQKVNGVVVAPARHFIAIGASEPQIAYIGGMGNTADEKFANARLIVAAPDLLLAAKNAETYIARDVRLCEEAYKQLDAPISIELAAARELLEQVQDAIRKAEGA